MKFHPCLLTGLKIKRLLYFSGSRQLLPFLLKVDMQGASSENLQFTILRSQLPISELKIFISNRPPQ